MMTFLMNRWILLIFTQVVIISCYAQDSINQNGYHYYYYPNGKISSEGTLVNGQPEGWWKSYNQDGILQSEGNRKNFQLDSTWTFYNAKGDTSLIIQYKEGKKEGYRIQFFEDEKIIETWKEDTIIGNVNTFYYSGKIKKTTPYNDGLPHGMEKTYQEDGLVNAIALYYRGVMTRRERINRTDNLGHKQGNWKYFWDNGNLKMEVTYLNDKKNGYIKYYDENGNFLSVEKYENDILQEDAKETKSLEKKTAYHPNGQPSIIATYYKGEPEGIRREFDTTGKVIKGYIFENGQVRFEGITDMNGKRQGLWREYYPSGELRSEGKFNNSNPVGRWKFFFINQLIEIDGNYTAKGQKSGEWKWYYPNGELMVVENYVNGELDGDYIEYDEVGNVIVQGVYIENTEDGEWIYYHGETLEKGSYYDGMRIGIWKVWYPNGKLASEINYDQDLMSGKFTSYWDNGIIKLSGKYSNGLQEGVWYKYNEEGMLFLTTLYKDGKELKWNNYNLQKQ